MKQLYETKIDDESKQISKKEALENKKFKIENIRPCLVDRKFFVFSIQTFRKQGKHV